MPPARLPFCRPLPPPLPLQFSIATIAHAINERMARQFEYLQERFHQASGGQLIRPPASASNDNAMGNDI